MHGQVLVAEEESSQDIKEWQQKCQEIGSHPTRDRLLNSNTFSPTQISGASQTLRLLVKDRHYSAFIFCLHEVDLITSSLIEPTRRKPETFNKSIYYFMNHALPHLK